MRCVKLKRSDLAALGDYQNEAGETRMSLAYDELIALLHLKVKQLEASIIQMKEGILK